MVRPAEREYDISGDISYYEHNGLLIYAIIKAESEEEAEMKAKELIDKVVNKS